MSTVDIDLGSYKLGWRDEIEYEFRPEKGLSEQVIRQMSEMKGEPGWMLDFRLKAYQRFLRKPIPQWGGGGLLNEIDFDNIYYYIKPAKEQAKSWDMVPESIKETYEKLGIPEAERKYLAGVTAQYECLRGDVRVYTADRGMVPIKEISAGDRVFSLDEPSGRLLVSEVKGATQTDVRQTYRIELEGGRVVYATDNHPFLAETDKGRVWRTVADLREGDLVTVANTLPDPGISHRPERPKGTPDAFPELTNPKVAWVFGYAVAGGSIDDDGVLTIVASGDVGAVLQGTIGREFLTISKLEGGRLVVAEKPLVRWFQRNGLIGVLDGRRIPSWVFGLPLLEKAAFLRGCLDASRESGLRGPLASDVAELAELASRIGEEAVGLAPVRSITPADVAPVFDIEVAGPHNFVAEGVVVHNSEVVYHRNREELERQGVLFCDTDTAVRKYPELVKEYFGTIIPPNDNKFAALNSAVWSGGSFIYCPPGVHVEQPLQAYFRINSENAGQFERTLIIIDEGAFAHYIEGCLPAGELVATGEGGYRPIEELSVGEMVLGHDGRPVRVRAKQLRDYRGPLYKVVPLSADNAFTVTGDHPVLIVRRQDVLVKRAPRRGWRPEANTARLVGMSPEWVPVKEVREGDFLIFPKPRPTPPKTVWPIEMARLIGYYLAEGSAVLTNGSKSVAFSFHIDDHESIDEVRRLCKQIYDTPGSVTWVEERHEARVLVYSIAAYEALRHHVGTRSHTKRLSPEVMSQDPSFVRNLVETYMRGDGNVTERGDALWYRAHTTSREWAHQLQAIMARLGVFATVRLARAGGPGEILGRSVNRRGLYTVQWTIGGSGPRQVRDAGDHFLVPIQRIEMSDFEGVVYNLDVPAPDSYLANGFAVHNCSAPIYTTDSLHSAVVEIVVKRGGRCRYTTIQNWSPNVFNLVTKRAAAYQDATMEWIDGNIGCLAEGSRVTTPSGLKPIELVQPGDQVLSWDDTVGQLTWRRVMAKRYSGQQPVRKVRIGQRQIEVTDNHPFLSYLHDPSRAKKLGRYRLGYVRADHLSQAIVPRSSIAYGVAHKLERPSTTPTFQAANQYGSGFHAVRERPQRLEIPDETTDELMWLFGLYLGDGSIESSPSNDGGRRWAKVVFSVPRSDRARERLLAVMSRLAPGGVPTERADGVTLSWSSVDLADLIEMNGFATGALKKRLPPWTLDLPESQRLALVAGILDSDGCAARGKRGFSVKSVNRSLLEDMGDVLTSLGVPARLHTESQESRKVEILGYLSVSRGAYRLDFPADPRLVAVVTPALRDAVSRQPATSTRSFRRVGRSQIELPATVEIRKATISEVGRITPTWDIEVEGTGNFVAEGFIVHNSRLTMKYPSVWLMEPGAHGEVLSIAYAGNGQHQDAGAKMVHAASHTSSTIVSKSISKDGGRAGYRGLVRVEPGAESAKSFVRCDALILDEKSRSDTYPSMEIEENDAEIGHEATVSKVGDEQLFYLRSRGLTEEQATSMIVAGFIEPIVRELPMEYAVEMNRLIELNMAEAGAIG
jgi:Fe-S cluster assembly scaffold protein SufB